MSACDLSAPKRSGVEWMMQEMCIRDSAMLDRAGSKAMLEVDGGANTVTAAEMMRRGADVIVAGLSLIHIWCAPSSQSTRSSSPKRARTTCPNLCVAAAKTAWRSF